MEDHVRNQIKSVFALWRDGLLTTNEAITRLDALRVRGGFNGSSFVGYDYRNQEWIEFTA